MRFEDMNKVWNFNERDKSELKNEIEKNEESRNITDMKPSYTSVFELSKNIVDSEDKFSYEPEKELTKIKDSKGFADPKPENMNLHLLQRNLGNCLNIIDDEVMKGYVTRLDQLPIIIQNEDVYNKLNDIHFFKISELVYQENEFSVDKLSMVFHTLSNKPCTLVLMLRSDGEKTEFYLGARPNDSRSSGTLFQMLKKSLLGFFPGSKITDYYDEEMKQNMQALNVGCISSVTSVADYKQEQELMTNREFIQGLEKFVYVMKGKSYTSIFIADNLSYDDLILKKREYEKIYTQISPFANMQMNFSVSDSKSDSTGKSDGKTITNTYTRTVGSSENESDTKTHTIGSSEGCGETITDTHTENESNSEGKVHTVGSSHNNSWTITKGKNQGTNSGRGFNLGLGYIASVGLGVVKSSFLGDSRSVSRGMSHTISVSDSVSRTLTHGFSDSKSLSNSKTSTQSENHSIAKSIGTSKNESDAYSEGDAFNLVNTQTMTDTFGTSRAITLNSQNMTLNLVMQRLQKHLERIEECESFGMWNFAAYFLGETAAETETAANIYKSVIAGKDSGIEKNAINSWNDKKSISDLMPYLTHFMHPQFEYAGFSYTNDRYISVNPSALVSTNELAIHMGLPRHSVRGLPVVEHASFGHEVISRKNLTDKRINIGNIFNMGQRTDTEVELDLNSLSMHTFVTGSTGSGKSNAVYHLLREVRKQGIPFLVIEPAKGEYKDVFTDIKCYGTNPLFGEMLRINPFSFPAGIHVLEHIDRIVEIFNVCWPMYAAMPAILKESIENAYKSSGWDLDLSINEKVDGLYPTFDDVLRELNNTINSSDYSSDTKGDYIGSLSTRIKSLTNGINGRIFVSNEMNLKELFDESAIIDISRVGSLETKSLIMGLIVMKLQEYRMSNVAEMNSPLNHITVLEEAHNLLKKTSTEQTTDSSNIVGKSVEMLTNAIAEIRTFGEGVVIVDQAPNLLDTAVIRNTNTKIVLRLPESTDREIMGGSISLKDQQFDEISKLPTGVAAVYQNDWQEAVLCELPMHEVLDFSFGKKEDYIPDVKKAKEEIDQLLHLLIKKDHSKLEETMVKELIIRSNVAAKVKKDLIINWKRRNTSYEWAIADFIKKNYDLTDVFRGTQRENWSDLSSLSEIMISNIQSEFLGFDKNEMLTILYYVCRIQHELYPKHQLIEKLRVEYLKDKVI